MSKFAEVLKDLRVVHNVTQSDLAMALGVSRSTVGMYELGEREPDFETLEAIADFFNVDMNKILGCTGSTAPSEGKKEPVPYNGQPADEVTELVSSFMSLSKQDKQRALDYLSLLENQYKARSL